MWTIDRIVGVKNSLQGARNDMQAILDRLSTEITRIEADSSRNQEWIRGKTNEARSKAMTALGPLMRALSERAAPVRAQSRFWESRNLLLGLEKFDQDPAKDSAIRQRYMAELAVLGQEELHLVADHARADGNLPLLWQAHLAGRRWEGVKGATGIDLAEVKVPGQADALQAIRDCQALVAAGEYIVAQTSGRVTSSQKLQFGRAMAQNVTTPAQAPRPGLAEQVVGTNQ